MATTTRSAYQTLLCRPEWHKTAHRIKERDGWRCVECKTMAEPGNYLQVDHKKYPQGAASRGRCPTATRRRSAGDATR